MDFISRFLATATLAACMASAATDGFVSLMPRQDVGEFWTIESTFEKFGHRLQVEHRVPTD